MASPSDNYITQVLLQSNSTGHYRAIGDQVDLAPKIKTAPEKNRHVCSHAAGNSRRFINKKYLKYKVSASIVFSWDWRSSNRIFH